MHPSVDIDRSRVLHISTLQGWRAHVRGAITISAGIMGLTFLQSRTWQADFFFLDSDD